MLSTLTKNFLLPFTGGEENSRGAFKAVINDKSGYKQEEKKGDDTNGRINYVTIKKMGIDNLGTSDLERSHRIGQKTDNRDRPHRRTIIVRFRSEAVRDDVYRSRTKLKNHNQHHRDEQVYINEDLTSKRAALAYKARSLKKENKINDCWTYTGRVLVKTNTGMIKEIHSAKDLDMY